MSTQRWEVHRQPSASESRAEAPELSSAPVTRFGMTPAVGRTARPEFPATQATNSLHQDHPLVRCVRPDARRGSPPLLNRRHDDTGTSAGSRSSRPLLSVLSGSVPLPPALPQAPVAKSHRAERYDGKRDLHFLHAA